MSANSPICADGDRSCTAFFARMPLNETNARNGFFDATLLAERGENASSIAPDRALRRDFDSLVRADRVR